MGTAVPLLLLSLAIILVAAELFTNSVEWLGHHLKLHEGAVGSILAAVGTAMPETMIPLVAILFSTGKAAEEIGVGAILGAPFMLSTAAFAVTGLSVLLFAGRRRQGTDMVLDADIVRRDFGYFIAVYVLAIVSTALPAHGLKVGVAGLLLGLYGLYVYRTLKDEGGAVEEPQPLYLARAVGAHANEPSLLLTALQFSLALGMIIGGAKVFVTNMEDVAGALGTPPLVLALILAPLATELPEKFNSIIWVRGGKDTLAMGNISGALVFQSCIPVAVGLLFTDWELEQAALVSATIALASTSIVFLSMRRQGLLSAGALARSGLFYLGFVVWVVLAKA
ncbi:MAG: sodium:calcium antiporter [Chloroflexi bacterium]|nr:sodium:calcium antiporter [Chloroflexota bacterium]